MLNEFENIQAINDDAIILANSGYGSREKYEMLEERNQDYVIWPMGGETGLYKGK